MTTIDDIKLDNIDSEDFVETLLKLEKSFGIRFANDSFKEAKTFGDLCDAVQSQINFADKGDCTTQQAFYKVRKAIGFSQAFSPGNLVPETKLEQVFPRANRRQHVKLFEQALGLQVDMLSMKNWLLGTIVAGILLSLISFFFSWLFAVAGLGFFILVAWVANHFSKELDISTVGELVKKISREHYWLARRHTGTVNKREIVKTIQDVFIEDHGLNRNALAREELLGQ